MASTPIPQRALETLIDRYDALLIDAYGVLVRSDGLLPGAKALMAHLHELQKPYLVLTNDASRQVSQSVAWYTELGMPLPAERIVTSGSLLINHYKSHDLIGAPTILLGPEGSQEYGRQAGAELVSPDDDAARVFVVCDDAGYDFLPIVEAALSTLLRVIDAGHTPTLILPNPDLIYPRGPGQVGLTSGAVALIFEAALELRYPERDDLHFVRLGKPFSPIYQAAVDKLGTRRLLMIGDQLRTDILGANHFGIDSALVDTGVTRWNEAATIRPTFRLRSPLWISPENPTTTP